MKKNKESEWKDYYKSLTGEQAFQERIKGRQPVIEINGHPFFIEARWEKLTPKDNFLSTGIDLSDAGELIDNHYKIYYDTKTMSQAEISTDITKLPENVVLIEIPSLYDLDPVMMAELRNKDPRAYLDQHPLIMYREAKVTPLEDTPLMELVQKNLEKLKASQPSHQREVKPSPNASKRKGNSL